jgi:hypothetical protein
MSKSVICAQQIFDGFSPNSAYGGLYTRGCNFPESGFAGTLQYSFALEIGKTYIVEWDNEEYYVVGQDSSAIVPNSVALGNGTAFNLIGNNEPFALSTVAGQGVIFISLTETVDYHKVAIYQVEEETLLPDDRFAFEYSQSLGVFAHSDLSPTFGLVSDNNYVVTWDNKQYIRKAFSFVSSDNSMCVGIGNPLAAGLSSNNDLFCVVYDITHNYVHYLSLEQTASHDVAVCKLLEDFEHGDLIFPSMNLTEFGADSDLGVHTIDINASDRVPYFNLMANETYTVYWDGEPYVCVALDAASDNGIETLVMGNIDMLGFPGGNTSAPFVIGWTQYGSTMADLYSANISHTVGIYYGVSTIHNKPVLLAETMLSGFEQDMTGFYGAMMTPAPFLLTANKEYVVVWDGVEYNVTAVDIGHILEGVVFAGNGADFIAPDSGEPFALTTYSDSEYSDMVFYALQDYDKEHTVAVYSADSDVFLPKTTFENSNYIACNKMLTAGDTYRVLFDDVEYIVVAQDIGEDDMTAVAVFVGEISNPEWFFATAYVDDRLICLLGADYDEGSHTIAIYYADEGQTPDDPLDPEPDEPVDPEPDEPVDPEEPETREGIILKDRNGQDVAYYGIETVTFDTTTENKRQVYSKGTVSDNMEVVPDFSNGDMDVSPSDADMTRSVTIMAPDDLKPENVRKGKEIAGVSGVFIGDTEEIVVGESDGAVQLDLSSDYQEITPSTETKVISKVTIERPDGLRPENILKNVEIAGVVGTYELNMDSEISPYVVYQIDTERNELVILHILFDKLYADTGSYDIVIPDKIGSFAVAIDSKGV